MAKKKTKSLNDNPETGPESPFDNEAPQGPPPGFGGAFKGFPQFEDPTVTILRKNSEQVRGITYSTTEAPQGMVETISLHSSLGQTALSETA